MIKVKICMSVCFYFKRDGPTGRAIITGGLQQSAKPSEQQSPKEHGFSGLWTHNKK